MLTEQNQKEFDTVKQLPQNSSNLAAITTKALIDSIGAFSLVLKKKKGHT